MEQLKPKPLSEEEQIKQLESIQIPSFWPSKEEMDEYEKIFNIMVDGGLIKLDTDPKQRQKQINGITVRLMYCKAKHYPAILFNQVYPVQGNFEVEVKLAEWLVIQRFPKADWEVIESDKNHVKMRFRRSPEELYREKEYTLDMAKKLIANATNTGVGGKQWQADSENMLVNRCKGIGFRMYFAPALQGVYLKGEIPEEITTKQPLTEDEMMRIEAEDQANAEKEMAESNKKKATKKATKKADVKPTTEKQDPPKSDSTKQQFLDVVKAKLLQFKNDGGNLEAFHHVIDAIKETTGLPQNESTFVALYDGDNNHPTIEDMYQLEGLSIDYIATISQYWEPHPISKPEPTAKPQDDLGRDAIIKQSQEGKPKKLYLVEECTPKTKQDKSPYMFLKLHETDGSQFLAEPINVSLFEGFEGIEMGFQITCTVVAKGKYNNASNVEIVERS